MSSVMLCLPFQGFYEITPALPRGATCETRQQNKATVPGTIGAKKATAPRQKRQRCLAPSTQQGNKTRQRCLAPSTQQRGVCVGMTATVVRHARLRQRPFGFDVTVDPALRSLVPADVEGAERWVELERRVGQVIVDPPRERA